MATANTPQKTALPARIEIFRAGTHVDDAGNTHAFSESAVASMAAGYNPALREAPLCVGHPASNLPAYGWVKGLTVEGGVLSMDTHQVEPQFAEMVQSGRFKKRSASFYPPNSPSNPTPGQWYLRHVAFLGAQPPAVAGLKDINFSETDSGEGAVNFSEAVLPPSTTQQETPAMDEETKKRLEQAEADKKAAQQAQADAEAKAKAAQDQLAQFSEQQRRDRHTGHVSFCESAVKAGKLLPANQATAVAVLDQLAESIPVEFSEGGDSKKVAPAEWLKGLIEGAKPFVQFGEFAAGNTGDSTKGMSDAEIDKRAKAYASQHNVSYSEALGRVVSFTG